MINKRGIINEDLERMIRLALGESEVTDPTAIEVWKKIKNETQLSELYDMEHSDVETQQKSGVAWIRASLATKRKFDFSDNGQTTKDALTKLAKQSAEIVQQYLSGEKVTVDEFNNGVSYETRDNTVSVSFSFHAGKTKLIMQIIPRQLDEYLVQ